MRDAMSTLFQSLINFVFGSGPLAWLFTPIVLTMMVIRFLRWAFRTARGEKDIESLSDDLGGVVEGLRTREVRARGIIDRQRSKGYRRWVLLLPIAGLLGVSLGGGHADAQTNCTIVPLAAGASYSAIGPLSVRHVNPNPDWSVSVSYGTNILIGYLNNEGWYSWADTSTRIIKNTGTNSATVDNCGVIPTNTPAPPTSTATRTATPTNTATATSVPPNATRTNTPVPPSATATSTSVPPSATATSVPPSATATGVPPTATFHRAFLPHIIGSH